MSRWLSWITSCWGPVKYTTQLSRPALDKINSQDWDLFLLTQSPTSATNETLQTQFFLLRAKTTQLPAAASFGTVQGVFGLRFFASGAFSPLSGSTLGCLVTCARHRFASRRGGAHCFSSASQLSLPPLTTFVFTHACYQIVVVSALSLLFDLRPCS